MLYAISALFVTTLSMSTLKERLASIKLSTNRSYLCGNGRCEDDFIQELEVRWEVM
jgi:hypothetical protein